MGLRPSMGSVGDAYDNEIAESFFASLKCELLNRTLLPMKSETRTELFSYIEGWYNPRRRRRSRIMMTPNAFKAKARKTQKREIEKATATLTGYPPGKAVDKFPNAPTRAR